MAHRTGSSASVRQLPAPVIATEVSNAHRVYWFGEYGWADGTECDEGWPYDGSQRHPTRDGGAAPAAGRHLGGDAQGGGRAERTDLHLAARSAGGRGRRAGGEWYSGGRCAGKHLCRSFHK